MSTAPGFDALIAFWALCPAGGLAGVFVAAALVASGLVASGLVEGVLFAGMADFGLAFSAGSGTSDAN